MLPVCAFESQLSHLALSAIGDRVCPSAADGFRMALLKMS